MAHRRATAEQAVTRIGSVQEKEGPRSQEGWVPGGAAHPVAAGRKDALYVLE